MESPRWSRVLAGPHGGPKLEPFLKNCSPREGLKREKFLEDLSPVGGTPGAGAECEESDPCGGRSSRGDVCWAGHSPIPWEKIQEQS